MENCRYYARFMSKLQRPAAEGLYWSLFAFLLILLFTASWRFGRTTERIEELRARDRERVRLLRHCFWFCLGCGFISLVVVVMEAFVIMALQFCDGEPIVSLYWATWTMLSVGGLIAIWGICLHVRHMITGKKHPPWALALGTPVLVVAGLGHYFQGKVRRSRAARSIKERSRSRGRTSEALSEVATIRAYSSESNRGEDTQKMRRNLFDDYNAKVVGYTKDGDVILRLAPNIREEFMSQTPLSSSITWEEPVRPTPALMEGNISSKHSRSRGRSSVSLKGKEKENGVATRGNSDVEVETVHGVSPMSKRKEGEEARLAHAGESYQMADLSPAGDEATRGPAKDVWAPAPSTLNIPGKDRRRARFFPLEGIDDPAPGLELAVNGDAANRGLGIVSSA
ncbi:hypothetical protein SLS53_004023 [Cytospora paraplurivora]|uniref:Uncharacterized protein n=1 Tax=Cytospora paraplurivora TaxID=2898453 RepID=A0AAN9UG58_9PEZI